MRIFLDTNVLFDLFAQRKPFFEDARRIIMMQLFGDAELWAAPQSYLDIFYVLSKNTDSTLVQERLLGSFECVNICSTEQKDLEDAAHLGWGDMEDALIATSCRKTRSDVLLTRDAKGFAAMKIPVFAPNEFFSWLREEQGISYDMGT